MTGKTHQILGLTSGVIVYLSIADPNYNPATAFSVLAGCYIATLLPDIDRAGTKIWENIPLGHEAGHIVSPLLKHRNFSHSILGLALVAGLTYLFLNKLPNYWGLDREILLLTSVVAYFSHLLADMFTVDGIPLFFPWKKMIGIPPKPFDGIRIETGKWFENLIIFPLLNLLFICIIILKWSTIKLILFK